MTPEEMDLEVATSVKPAERTTKACKDCEHFRPAEFNNWCNKTSMLCVDARKDPQICGVVAWWFKAKPVTEVIPYITNSCHIDAGLCPKCMAKLERVESSPLLDPRIATYQCKETHDHRFIRAESAS